MKLTPLFLAIIAAFFVFALFVLATEIKPMFLNSSARSTHYFLTHKWCFDDVNNALLNKPLLQHAYNGPFVMIDRGLLEYVGPTGLSTLIRRASHFLVSVQTGRAYDYAGLFLAALCVVLLIADTFSY